MKHTINQYKSDTLEFNDTIEIKGRPSAGIKLVASNYIKGETSDFNESVIIRLNREQTIALIEDLTKTLANQ